MNGARFIGVIFPLTAVGGDAVPLRHERPTAAERWNTVKPDKRESF